MAADAGEQCPTSADAGSDDLLREALPSPVSAVYRYNEPFLFSKLMALFHFGSAQFWDDLAHYYALKLQRVGWLCQSALFAQPPAHDLNFTS